MAEPAAPDSKQRQTEPKPRGARAVISFFKELPILLGLALVIALLIKVFLVQAFFIPSESMLPTLEVKDRVLVSKLSYRLHEPRRGDVVVFRDPYGRSACGLQPCNAGRRAYLWFAELFGLPTGDTRDYIKRIIGLPGETIRIRDGDVYANGKLVKIPHTAGYGPQKDQANMADYTIPAGSYWVMGDNRANSSDSRVFKAISRDKIIGRAFVLLWPPNRFRSL